MIHEYGMFSDSGNRAVESIVILKFQCFLSWPTVKAMLAALALEEAFAEATDTAVREAVYNACFD